MIIINVYHQRLSLKLPNHTVPYIREYRTSTVQKSTKIVRKIQKISGIWEKLGNLENLKFEKRIYERNK